MKQLLLLLLACTYLNQGLTQQNIPAQPSAPAVLLGQTIPFSDLEDEPAVQANFKKSALKYKMRGSTPNRFDGLPHGADPLLDPQRNGGSLFDGNVLVNVEGMVFANSLPPDPAGDVGPNHYVQMINGFPHSRLLVKDKSGATVLGPVSTNAIWAQVGISDTGDPIVAYDEHADRWILLNYSRANAFVLAISVTNDPTGSWRAYRINTPDFPDYPKIFIWENSYYVSYKGANNWVPVVAIDRAAMLSGATTASTQTYQIPRYNGQSYQVANGGDWDGATPPPPGSPAYLVRMYDDAWDGGQDKLDIWSLNTDWATPANSTATGPMEIPVAPFDAEVCGNDFLGCVVQKGSATKLDALHKIIMHRVQYRNFGTHETMVLNHTVDASGTEIAGVRWYELRKTGNNPWQVYQQGTHAPDDNSRFMASIAMNGAGDIALSYAMSSDTIYPSLYVTGRRNNDPLGQMTMAELPIGLGLNSNPNDRWGDYSATGVDPADDRTFWLTGEVAKASNFGTRIAAISLGQDSFDLSVNAVLTPSSANGLSNAATVSLRLVNTGLFSQSNFSAGYKLDGQTVPNLNIAGPLAPGDTLDVTIPTNANLGQVGAVYELIAYCNSSSDTNPANDTICTNIRHLPNLDAALVTVTGTAAPWCSATQDMQVWVKNTGTVTLTQVRLNVELNGLAAGNQVFNTSIQPGATQRFTYTLGPVNLGLNQLKVYSSLPNGQADEYTLNDSLLMPLNYSANGTAMTLTVLTDNSPWESNWEILGEDGTLYYAGGPYLTANTTYQHTLCLLDSVCYRFKFYDSYGDGLTDGGPGNFILSAADGREAVVMDDADFGSEFIQGFCAACRDFDITVNTFNETTAGANNGRMAVIVTNGRAPYRYSKNAGQTWQSSQVFLNLSGGYYTIYVEDAEGCTDSTVAFITTAPVGTTNIPSLNIQASIEPNPVQDAATIRIQGYLGQETPSFSIIDLNGRILLDGQLSLENDTYSQWVDLGMLPQGLYFVRLQLGAGHTTVLKLVKD